MNEPRDRRADGGADPASFDAELDLRAIATFGIGLTLTMIVVLWIVWLLLAHWRDARIAHDPPPSPIAEARAPRPPPEPRLQSAPVRDMEELRAREDSILSSYGWVDRQAGIGRIPIDRAFDLLLEKGLPGPRPAGPQPRKGAP
jgi:hypothetical protein